MITRGLFNWNECKANLQEDIRAKEIEGLGYYEGHLAFYQNKGRYYDQNEVERFDDIPTGEVR